MAAPLLLALCRFGQGLGLGGEWGGAVLLAIENAPPGKRAWYGMFPQLGAPLGFFFSGGVFLLLSRLLTDEQFFRFGWRIPFLASAVLVLVGLYVRLTITETPVFRERAQPRASASRCRCSWSSATTPGTLVVGILASLATFVLFYLMTVFALSWGTTALGYTREHVPDHPAVRHRLLRADDSAVGGARGARPAAHADRGHGGDRARSVW